MVQTRIFKPRPSSGWLMLALIGLVALVATVLPAAISPTANRPAVSVIVAVLGGAIGLFLLLLAALFPFMRYRLESGELVLSLGPLSLYHIPYIYINKISERDLSVSLVSSFRLPGVAMFKVPYNDVGVVRMLATAASTRILLIETEKGRYGITPADDREFIAALKEHIQS